MSVAAKSATKQRHEFDQAKLEAMVEPLTVDIEKMISGRAQPVELPIKPDQRVAGVGWSKEDIRELPTFLGRIATGAGLVNIKITDANGTSMKWEWFFSPADYAPQPALSNNPSAPPSQLPGQPLGAAAMQQQPMMAPQQQYAPAIDPYGGWLGTVTRQPAPGTLQGSYRAQPATAYGSQMPQGPAMYPQFSVPPPITTADDRLRDEREARLRLEADMSRQQLENRYKEQIGAVSGEVRQLQTAISGIAQTIGQRPAGEEVASAATRALEAKIAALEASAREDKLIAMIAANQQQTAQLIQSMQANTDRQIAALAAASKPSGPDPTMTMMMQMQKDASDRQMQMMQMQMQQAAASQSGQLGPRELIELTRPQISGQEQVAVAYSKAWEMMMQGVETILHAQGPGVHPIVPMIEQGMASAAEMFGRSMEVKEKVGMQQANAAAMQAQANMHLANQLAMQRQQQQLAGQQAPAAPQAQAPAAAPQSPEADGDGEGDDQPGEEGGDADQGDQGEPEQEAAAPAQVEPLVDDAARAARLARDRENFGPPGGKAMIGIKRLRKGVGAGLLDPKRAAAAIIQGVDQGLKAGVKSPFLDLWLAGRLPEMVDLMLPDAPILFREHLVEEIITFVKQVADAARKAQREEAGAE